MSLTAWRGKPLWLGLALTAFILLRLFGDSTETGRQLFSFLPPYSQLNRESISGENAETVFGFLDHTNLYQKNGLVELYGLTLQQRQHGPISISKSILHIHSPNAFLFWFPDYSPAKGATHLQLKLSQPLSRGSIKIGLMDDQGKVYLYSTAAVFPSIGRRRFKDKSDTIPENRQVAILNPELVVRLGRQELSYSAPLPKALTQAMSKAPANNQLFKGWFIQVQDAKGQDIGVESLALVRNATAEDAHVSRLTGQVTGTLIYPGATVVLITESGQLYQHQLSINNRYVFEDLPPNMPVSLRYEYNGRDYYSTLGRWFIPGTKNQETMVDLEPLYKNPTAQKANAPNMMDSQEMTDYGAYYQPHTQITWNGMSAENIQEYATRTFTNNYGFVDRDRFVQNADHCLRLVHLGSSHSVALQVKPFEKYNMELESELGVKLGRCVEVMTAGHDNGDVGDNFRRMKYAAQFNPDAILLENSASLTSQLSPTLLKAGEGWNAEHNAIDSFYYNAGGKLSHRNWDSNYGMYMTEPTLREYSPGVPFWDTLKLPFPYMSPEGREAFKYLADIVNYYQNNYPQEQFILHDGLDEAQCHGKCNRMINLQGQSVPLGATVFSQNFEHFCEKNGFTCLYPHVKKGEHETEQNGLTWIYDAHYNQQGHQWLARELAHGLAKLFVEHSDY